jgi:glutamate racemase
VNQDARRVIGVFDSGVGGLSVWREIVALLPSEGTIYFADQSHCPYGSRPLLEIRALAEAIVCFHHLRERFDVPIVGMEPAVKPAAQRTASGKVGVMATPATFEGEPFARLMGRFARDVEVIRQVCPGLVERIEAGQLEGPEVEALLRNCLQPLVDEGVDVLVLGCTHYPFLRPAIEQVVGPGVEVIDPAPAVARQVRRVLARQGLLRPRQGKGRHAFYTSGAVKPFAALVERLMGERREAM